MNVLHKANTRSVLYSINKCPSCTSSDINQIEKFEKDGVKYLIMCLAYLKTPKSSEKNIQKKKCGYYVEINSFETQ